MKDIVELSYDADVPLFRVEFVNEQHLVKLSSEKIMMFNVCTTPGDHETPWVGDITVKVYDGLMKEELKKLGYQWVQYSMPSKVTHIHIEGAVVIDILVDGELAINNSFLGD